MRLMLPKEHGAWAMWIAPYIVGIGISDFQWFHIPLLISIFFAYIAISPFLQGIRKTNERKQLWQLASQYILIASIIGIPIILFYPKLIIIIIGIIPILLINIFYTKSKNERSLLNDFFAILALNSTLFASYYLGALQYDFMALYTYLLMVSFFIGSVFYVKTIYREQHNSTFKVIAKIYMILLPLLAGLVLSNILLMLAFLFSTIRIFIIPKGFKHSPKKVGITEIINTIWFAIFVIISI